MDDPTFPITSVDLRRVRFAAETHMDRAALRQLAFPSEVLVKEEMERLVLRVRQDVLAQHLDRAVVSYPATCWQHLKQRFAPRWLLCRWPVRMETRELNAYALYPYVGLPHEKHTVRVQVGNLLGAAPQEDEE